MKTLIIAIFIIISSLSAKSQFHLGLYNFFNYIPVPESGLTFYWNGYGVRSSDSALFNMVTGFYDSNTKLLGGVANGYISAKSANQLVFYGDTVPITCLFPNYNYADTLYFQMAEHTLNADSTENLPYRLTEIAYYSSDKTGVDSTTLAGYFGVPAFNSSAITVGTEKDYATIPLAVTASSAEDTIYLFDRYETNALNPKGKELTVINVGNSKIAKTSNCATSLSALDYLRLERLWLNSTNGSNTISNSASTGKLEVTNCYLQTTGNAINKNTATTDSVIVSNCVIEGKINTYGDVVLNENYFASRAYNIRARENLTSNYDYFAGATTYILGPGANQPDTVDINGSTINGQMIVYGGLDQNMEITINDAYLAASINNMNIQSDTDTVNINFDNCTFVNTGGGYQISKKGEGNITFNDCDFLLASKIIACLSDTSYVGEWNFTFTDNIFDYDSISELSIKGYDCNFNGNGFKNTNIYVENIDTIRIASIDSNTFHYTDSCFIYIIAKVEFADNTFRQDTGTTLLFDGDTITIERNSFAFNVETEQGNLIDILNDSVAYIDENLIECPGYYGYSTLNHLFNTSNSTFFRRNKVYNATIGCVSKNYTNDVSHEFEVIGNIFIECGTPIFLKTMPRAKVYNNTIYNNIKALTQFIYMDDNDGDYASTDCDIRNNIVYSTTGNFITVGTIDSPDTTDMICDHNINYNIGYSLDGTDYTFSEWQSFRFDMNGYNTNPNFSSTTNLWPVTPTDADGNGVNLGTDYDDILLNTSTWPSGVNTTTQDASWDIGAYKIE